MGHAGFGRRTWQVGRAFAGHLLGDRGQPVSRRVRAALVDVGPTFVKAGQLVASSPGLFPPGWIAELDGLRDRVPPFPGTTARRIVEGELGRPLRSAFAHFGDEPLAAAFIAQVHPATLPDGRPVVVKVQRPGLAAQVEVDVRALRLLCEVLERIPQTAVASPRALAEDFARTLGEEMDFRLEAENMDRMRAVLARAAIIGRLTPSVRARLAAYVFASTRNDYPGMVAALRQFGSVPAGVDEAAVAADLERRYAPFVANGVVVAQLGAWVETMIRSMVRWRVRIPRELVLLAKQMLYLEGAAHSLAPDLDLLQEQQLIHAALVAKHPELGGHVLGAVAPPVASSP